jgi:hypothetical protein
MTGMTTAENKAFHKKGHGLYSMKHEWKGQQSGGNPAEIESYEWICYCDNCGVEMDDDNKDEDCPSLKEQ